MLLVSCKENINPEITNSKQSDSDSLNPEESNSDLSSSDLLNPEKSNTEINSVAEALFSSNSERFTFDELIKFFSDSGMTAELIDKSKTEAKISIEDGAYYPVNPNMNPEIKISPLDTFIEILNNCEYIETESLGEPVIYTFIFHAVNINGTKDEICVYVTRSCIKIVYNGVSGDFEYANMSVNDEYKNVCYGYDYYIHGIIPDENNQLYTIW